MTTNTKAKLLSTPVEHFDITKIDARPIIEAMGKMSFTARELGWKPIKPSQDLNCA